MVTNDPRRTGSSRAANRHGKRLGSQRSQALVEFAVVAPLFLLVVFSAIDISRLLYAYTAISSAARDGARGLDPAQPGSIARKGQPPSAAIPQGIVS